MASRPGICSISLGRAGAGHSLRHRLDMAQFHGFKGIELFHEDLISVAKESHPTAQTFVATPAQELAAAHAIRIMCTERGLSVICLQPFWQYEGLLDRADHFEQLTVKLPLWLLLAEALGTNMIQVPSNFLPAYKLSSDPAIAVGDLRKMADAGLAFGGLDAHGQPVQRTTTDSKHFVQRKPIRFAYEALAWGTRCDTWEQAWQTVLAVDRPNFGLLLDTFNLAGSRVFADPASASPLGLVQDAYEKLVTSLERLVAEVDVAKVFYIQVASAEKLAEPLVEGHELYDADQPSRMSWSRSCRLFYGEEGTFPGVGHADTTDQEQTRSTTPPPQPPKITVNGNDYTSTPPHTPSATNDGSNSDSDNSDKTLVEEHYLPVKTVAHAIFVDLGFRGWVSHEVFNRRAWDQDADVPQELAGRAAYSWAKLCTEFQLHSPAVPRGQRLRAANENREVDNAAPSSVPIAVMGSSLDLFSGGGGGASPDGALVVPAAARGAGQADANANADGGSSDEDGHMAFL